jgi:FkbM family methyltransferase
MFSTLLRQTINRSPTLFTLRHRLAMLPATLEGPAKAGQRTWSQHGEDERLAAELKDVLQTGYYVDIGANHPAVLSNTYRLYCMGMRGICVEPNELLCKLHERYRRGDVIISAAVGGENGLLPFYEMSYHAFNTFSEEAYQRYVSEGKMTLVRKSLKPMFRLETILKSCAPEGKTFELLSVDVEGLDEMVLRSNDWQRFRPKLVLAEANTDEAEKGTGAFLKSLGYQRVGTFGVNGLYKSASS